MVILLLNRVLARILWLFLLEPVSHKVGSLILVVEFGNIHADSQISGDFERQGQE